MPNITFADAVYAKFLAMILDEGEHCSSRNHDTISNIRLPLATFTSVPVVTLRKTAWKKAIEEMAWFMSGEDKCPDNLLPWWKGQLDEDNRLRYGYPHQLRHFGKKGTGVVNSAFPTIGQGFDQIKFILEGLTSNPNSRRLLLTTWHPEDMAYITEHNNNPNTPTSCHNICTQFFVRDGALWMKTYQRSADMLLGVPHNWVQSWAMLLYLAHHSGLTVGGMIWNFGDAHVYKEDSHLKVANLVVEAANKTFLSLEDDIVNPLTLTYNYSGTLQGVIPEFRAEDFTLEGEIFSPITDIRPVLL